MYKFNHLTKSLNTSNHAIVRKIDQNSITNRIEQSLNHISNISTDIRDQHTTCNPFESSFPFGDPKSKVTIPLDRRGRQPLGGPFFSKRNKSTVFHPVKHQSRSAHCWNALPVQARVRVNDNRSGFEARVQRMHIRMERSSRISPVRVT